MPEAEDIRVVKLPREPPFRLGGSTVTPSLLEIDTAGRKTKLEPRPMEVLVALAQRQGGAVTRDELVASCWQGWSVSDDAVHYAVTKLRRLHEHGVSFEIETIPRVGYRLKVLEAEASDRPPSEETPRPVWRWTGRWALIGAALAVLAAAGVGAWSLLPTEWRVENYRLATSDPGEEITPDLSPDGRFVAYARPVGGYPPRNGPFRSSLLYRSVDGGDAVELTDEDGVVVAPKWSPSGREIAYIAPGMPYGSAPCRFMVRPFPVGAAREVGRCEGLSPTQKLDWTHAGDALIVSDDPPGGLLRLRRLDVATGKARDLTHPPAGAFDITPAMSPDGRKLAFMRQGRGRTSQVMVRDLASGVETQVAEIIHGWCAWSGDGKTLFVTTLGSEIMTYPVGRRGAPQVLQVGVGVEYWRAATAQGLFAFEVHTRDGATFRRTADGAEVPVEAGGIDALHPTIAPDGTLAIPDSGDWIVAQSPGQAPHRLARGPTNMEDLTWAPDARLLAATGNYRHGRAAFIVDSVTGRIQRVPFPGDLANSPAFSHDGRTLAFVGEDSVGARVWLYDLQTAKLRALTGPGWAAVRAGPDAFYAVPTQGGAIMRLGADGSAVKVADFSPYNPGTGERMRRAWTIVGDRVYRLDTPASGGPGRVIEAPLSGGPERVVVSGVKYLSLAVDPVSGDLVYRRATGPEEVNIALLRLSQHRRLPF
jgi:Tol biopolymer transport system component/DNA-binding winged helix-turn-helix (wHTH) protein